jgi:hypothetical protein
MRLCAIHLTISSRSANMSRNVEEMKTLRARSVAMREMVFRRRVNGLSEAAADSTRTVLAVDLTAAPQPRKEFATGDGCSRLLQQVAHLAIEPIVKTCLGLPKRVALRRIAVVAVAAYSSCRSTICRS